MGVTALLRFDPKFWQNRRVLLTGHTGFKGAWLSLWLQQLGTRVASFALPPETSPNLHDLAKVSLGQQSYFADLADRSALGFLVQQFQPEIVIHMAAQAIVRRGYDEPLSTFQTNVIGTIHLLESLRDCPSVVAALVVTSDKCYENDNRGRAFLESDPLGGSDPYSASKGAQEIVAHSWRRSFFKGQTKIISARAGNVIGGGDWSANRLIPDLIRARTSQNPLLLRYPQSTRPWQHVLEPLGGYLLYLQAIASGCDLPSALNFGPAQDDVWPVAQVIETLQKLLPDSPSWQQDGGPYAPEAQALVLDASLANQTLGWTPRLPLSQGLAWLAQWYDAHASGADVRALTLTQISRYQEMLLP